MKVVGIIPCRYGSSRFPGKSLALIKNHPMMWHVYQRCLESEILDDVYIATDDKRIEKEAINLGMKVIMTYGDHLTGTDRVSEVVGHIDSDYYVNIQGDEPMLDPEAIVLVTNAIVNSTDPMVHASNAYAPIKNPCDVVNSNVVKVITDIDSNALAYSRQPIPYPRSNSVTYLRQLGLYAFTKNGLKVFNEKKPQILEQAEGIEMFRLLEHGYKVKMVKTSDDSVSVDTIDDLIRVQKKI